MLFGQGKTVKDRLGGIVLAVFGLSGWFPVAWALGLDGLGLGKSGLGVRELGKGAGWLAQEKYAPR